jgi:hypothetical protein
VQGRRGARFVYLTWGTFADGTFTMFRRAKLMLDDLPREADAVTVEVHLTDETGMPRCARRRRRCASCSDGSTEPDVSGTTRCDDRTVRVEHQGSSAREERGRALGGGPRSSAPRPSRAQGARRVGEPMANAPIRPWGAVASRARDASAKANRRADRSPAPRGRPVSVGCWDGSGGSASHA